MLLQGDTLQGVAAELNCVLDSGYYRFMFNSTTDAISATAELHYIPHSTRYQNVGEVKEQPIAPTEYKWSEDQISDFVRKLGFLDAEGTAASQIKTFLHLNQVSVYTGFSIFAYIIVTCRSLFCVCVYESAMLIIQTAKKLLGLYSKLRELGHPDYLQRMVPHELKCSVTQDEADEMVLAIAFSTYSIFNTAFINSPSLCIGDVCINNTVKVGTRDGQFACRVRTASLLLGSQVAPPLSEPDC